MKKALAGLLCMPILCAALLASCVPAQQTRLQISDAYRNYYEIFVGSFYDSNGDGTGDLNGVTQKLSYIRDIGADGIWLTPVYPSPSYHKYDITDYNSIDPQFGTVADFENLLEKAHGMDIRVLMDLVVQHTSVQHPWFLAAVSALQQGQQSKYTGYYRFSETPLAGYHEYGASGIYYSSVFSPDMPDLNLDNADVRGEITGIMSFWLGKGVDGFRLDATTSYYPGSPSQNGAFMGWLSAACKRIKPDAYLVGEAWTASSEILTYYSSGIDSFFNYPFATVSGTINAAINNRNGAALAAQTGQWNAEIRAANPAAMDAVFLSNHDNPRPAGYLMRDARREKLSAAVYLLMPGCSFLYYGEEIGMLGSGSDPNKRMPMLWSSAGAAGITNPPPGGSYDERSVVPVDQQLADPGSLLNFYKSVLALKDKYPAIARGAFASVATPDASVCAFCDTYKGEKLYVFENLDYSIHTINLSLLGLPSALAIRDQLLTDGSEIPKLSGGSLTLPPYSIAFLR